MTKLILKKCKSIILILLIVPMFMLSFNSQRASAFVPAIATPVVIGEVTISTGALVALAGTTLVAGGVLLDKNANDGTACKYIARKMVDTGNVAQYVGVSVKDSGEKVLTWTKEGLSFFQSTLTSAKSDGIPIKYVDSIPSTFTCSTSWHWETTCTANYNPPYYKFISATFPSGNFYVVSGDTADTIYTSNGTPILTVGTIPDQYIQRPGVMVSDGGGSICVPIPSSYNNYNYAPDVLGSDVTANDGSISYRPKVGVPLTDTGTKTDKGSIVYNPTMDIPYGKTWSDIKDTVAIPTTTTDTKGTTTNTTTTDTDYDIKINVDSINRIFNNKTGHLTSNTAENRKILELVANYEGNYIGMDYYENEWYTGINSDGTQTWVEVTNDEIVNGGVNEFPIKFDVQSVNNIDDTTIEDTGTTSTTSAAVKPEFRNQDLLDEHFDKHVIKKKEFGNMTKDEYLKGAQDLVEAESGGDILTKTRTNGDKIFYREATNELVITNRNGNLKTYFKPKNKIEYYNKQK